MNKKLNQEDKDYILVLSFGMGVVFLLIGFLISLILDSENFFVIPIILGIFGLFGGWFFGYIEKKYTIK